MDSRVRFQAHKVKQASDGRKSWIDNMRHDRNLTATLFTVSPNVFFIYVVLFKIIITHVCILIRILCPYVCTSIPKFFYALYRTSNYRMELYILRWITDKLKSA